MATHSSILSWRILWMEDSGGLLSMGSHKSQTRLRQLSMQWDDIQDFYILLNFGSLFHSCICELRVQGKSGLEMHTGESACDGALAGVPRMQSLMQRTYVPSS